MMNTNSPVDYDQLFPGRFLKAGLLEGKERTLTISKVELEALPQDNGKDRSRGVLSFKEVDEQLVLNSTNGQCIAAMLGRKVQEWVGHRITLVPDEDMFGREKVPCIRIKGSPELKSAVEVEIKLPRKKPRKRTLVPTGNGARQQAAPPTEEQRIEALTKALQRFGLLIEDAITLVGSPVAQWGDAGWAIVREAVDKVKAAPEAERAAVKRAVFKLPSSAVES